MNPISDYRRSTTPSPAVLVPPIPTTDGELLMRFARHGDDAAFTQLVEKHGRLVWTVCWQVLRQHHEIEDAFQATFFILAKRARSIRSCDSLCGWLYRVAYRTALRSRMSSKRKQLMELVNDELATLDEKLKRIEQDEQRAALMEELHSLPEQYQMPLVLCYLEGKSRRAAAEELGTTIESVKGRLTRGRQLLRHRLIRRGVSLSVAMAAMSIPVKAATASVTPALVGLTATGAAAWSALSSKLATNATTVSTNVSTLAQQGTVAMTLASHVKPVVVALALLTGVSAAVAVDSLGKGTLGGEGQGVNLAVASPPNENQEIQLAAAEGDSVTVAPIETAKADSKSKKRSIAGTETASKKLLVVNSNSQMTIEPGTVVLKAGEMGVVGPIEVGKPRQAAPARVPATIELRAPAPPADVMLPAMPAMAEFPFMREFNWQMNHELNADLQLKIAELQSKVSHLQLESKELEIQSFGADEKDRKALLEESKKKLLMAEAEELKIQMERQRAQIEELRKAVEEQAKEIGKKAKRAGEEAKKAANTALEEAKIAGKMAAEQARMAADEVRAVAFKEAHLAQANAQSQAGSYRTFTPMGSAADLKPGCRIRIQARGVDPESPLDDIFVVEPMGTVALGVEYGRVNVEGLSVIDAEKVILEHLKKDWEKPRVQVTFEGAQTYEPRQGN